MGNLGGPPAQGTTCAAVRWAGAIRFVGYLTLKAWFMKTLLIAISALSLVASAASAQPHDDRRDRGGPPGHDNHDSHDNGVHAGWGHDYGAGHHWRHGERMGWNDWNNAPVVDYRARHLRRPPHGYEWRESNGQYVLAAVATGLIASIIINSQH